MLGVDEMTAADCARQAGCCRAEAETVTDPKRTFLLRIAMVWDRLGEYKAEKNA